MKKLIIILMLCMMLTTIAATQDSLGTFQKDREVELLQICGTCTYNNITSIVLPNSTRLVLDEKMTRRGAEYNYTFSKANLSGVYLVNGIGDLDGTDNAWAYDFEITGTGHTFSLGLSVFYIAVMAVLMFLFIIGIIGYINLPNTDPKDFDGKLLDISWLKYLRYPLGVLCWGFLTMIFFLGWNVSEGFFATTLVPKIFEVLYTLNFYALMITIPILFLHIITKAIQDKKFQRMLNRGIFDG